MALPSRLKLENIFSECLTVEGAKIDAGLCVELAPRCIANLRWEELMKYRRAIKAFGLSIFAVLGLMAFAAGGAQASGTFLIQNLAAPWTASAVGEGENLLESYRQILKLNIKIKCHSAIGAGSIKNTGHGHITINLFECLATDNSLDPVECSFHEPIQTQALVLVVLHGVNPYVLFSPLDGLTFAIVKTLGEFCTLPKEVAVKGSIVASISNPGGDDVTKLISTKNMLSLFTSDKLFYGAHEMHLVADGIIRLAGQHNGHAWGAT